MSEAPDLRVRIGPDGRLYLGALTPELFAALRSIFPEDPVLQALEQALAAGRSSSEESPP
jgi:hypothetical protein